MSFQSEPTCYSSQGDDAMGFSICPAYTQRFWAKAHPFRQRGPERIHLLEHHLADVGACFEALLEQPTIRQRLAQSGRRDDLDDATVARLCVFAALHDIGNGSQMLLNPTRRRCHPLPTSSITSWACATWPTGLAPMKSGSGMLTHPRDLPYSPSSFSGGRKSPGSSRAALAGRVF